MVVLHSTYYTLIHLFWFKTGIDVHRTIIYITKIGQVGLLVFVGKYFPLFVDIFLNDFFKFTPK